MKWFLLKKERVLYRLVSCISSCSCQPGIVVLCSQQYANLRVRARAWLYTRFFLYKKHVYKKHEAEIRQK